MSPARPSLPYQVPRRTEYKRFDVLDELLCQICHRLLAGPGHMPSDNEVVELQPQWWMSRHRGFGLQGVDSCPADAPLRQRIGQRVLIDNAAAGAIDQQRIPLH